MTKRVSVPTVTIGGFLGAGKTTLVNHILGHAEGQRFVVFVNDFGAINIDHSLIETVQTDRIALSNGCVCCSLNDDLVRAMVGFCETDPPDAFVIETSGVANPKALDVTLHALAQSGLAHMHRRIYVLDTDQFGGLDYADTEDLVDHAASSDLVVLNKSDLVAPERLADVTTLLTRSAPHAAIYPTAFAHVPIDQIMQSPPPTRPALQIARDTPHDTATLYDTYAFKNFPPLTHAGLTRLSDALKDMCLRAKGQVQLDDPPGAWMQLQLVGRRLDLQQVSDGAQLGQTLSRLVVIGWANRIDKNRIADLLNCAPVTAR